MCTRSITRWKPSGHYPNALKRDLRDDLHPILFGSRMARTLQLRYPTVDQTKVISIHGEPVIRGADHVLVRDSSKDFEVVHVFGDLDLSSADELESMLVALSSQKHTPSLAVDLTACHYLDSTILTVFVRAARELDDRFALIIPTGNPVRRILHIVALDQVVHIEESLQEAAQSLGVTLPAP